MKSAREKRNQFKYFALAILMAGTLSSCGSETTTSYADVDESEAATALTSDFTGPIYPGSTLYEVKRSDGPGSVTVIGSFHTTDACPDISDWYSRRLRMMNWVVTGIEKESNSCEVIANKGKEECKLNANNNGSQTTIVIKVVNPK